MRNPFEFAQKIWDVIPSSDSTIRMKGDIERLKYSFAYRPPEMYGQCWHELSMCVNHYIFNPIKEEWQIKVIALLMNETEEEIRNKFYEKP